MNFSEFQTDFLNQLKLRNENCLNLIENNKTLIEENLNSNSEILIKFVDKINKIIIKIDKEAPTLLPIKSSSFKLVERVLRHPYLREVLDKFKNSEVLIEACKVGNKNAAKWILTMEVSPYVQDQDGMSAQMYAAQQGFDFVVEPYLYDSRCMNLEDNNGDNVLFHALRNPSFITTENNDNTTPPYPWKLITSFIDINHINKKGESALTHCIKNDIFKPINQYLLRHPKIDVNIADEDGIPAVMYLAEKGRYSEFLTLHKRNCNYDYIDMKGQSALSVLTKKIYSTNEDTDPDKFGDYIRTLSAMVYYQCDLNIQVDHDENTLFMVNLIVDDIETALFCAKNLKKLDLSIKNRYGEDGTSLCFKLGRYELFPFIKDNPTFDHNYRDPMNQNTLLLLSAINSAPVMKELLENDPSIINEVNYKNENALIIASKINHIEVVTVLLERGINVNQRDDLGNTALHYAVLTENLYLIYLLVKKKIDILIKNKEGKSALDLAHELHHEEYIPILMNLSYSSSSSSSPSSSSSSPPPPFPSIDKDKIQSSINKENKYYQEIQNYLMPYANNDYPDYKLTKSMTDDKNEIYTRNERTDDEDFYRIIAMMFPITGLSIMALRHLKKKFKSRKKT